MPAPGPVAPAASFGAVVLSMGNRTAELGVALDSLLAQRGVALDVVVVGNGWEPTGLPPGVRAVALPDNVGVPEGRNIGAGACSGELLLFYDDDAWLPSDDVLLRLGEAFDRHPGAAVVQPRATDPTGLPSPRRWVPRLRADSAQRPGTVAVFWEGVFAVRRQAFDAVGGWPGHFFFAHEGIDLAWRLWDAGWTVWYEPSVLVHHPATEVTRHDVYYRNNARNRAWVARRNLPPLLAVTHLLVWTVLTVLRVRSVAPLRVWFAGLREGLTTDPGTRRPMSWHTAWRLLRTGRPPVI